MSNSPCPSLVRNERYRNDMIEAIPAIKRTRLAYLPTHRISRSTKDPFSTEDREVAGLIETKPLIRWLRRAAVCTFPDQSPTMVHYPLLDPPPMGNPWQEWHHNPFHWGKSLSLIDIILSLPTQIRRYTRRLRILKRSYFSVTGIHTEDHRCGSSSSSSS